MFGRLVSDRGAPEATAAVSHRSLGLPRQGWQAGHGMGERMRDQDGQLTLFCRGCCGSGVVVVDAPNHDGEQVRVPAPCLTCRPSPTLAETWLAVARLARRLDPS
jgi:hypothetical protein